VPSLENPNASRWAGPTPTASLTTWAEAVFDQHQVVIHADAKLVVAVGTPLPGNRRDSQAFAESGTDHATRTATAAQRFVLVSACSRRGHLRIDQEREAVAASP
jgi:hypothetical protein